MATELISSVEISTMRKIIFFLLLLSACKSKDSHTASPVTQRDIKLKYAKGFTLSKIGNATLVEVTYPYQGALSGHRYLLVQKGDSVPAIENASVIRVPVNSIVCTSTTHIPMLDYIGETDKLVGFPTLDYISSKKMRQRIDSGLVTDLGIDKGMNIEVLAALQPELVMGYSISGNYGQFRKIESMDIPVVINAEYLERDPLGRAEWIKFVAAFFNKEEMADSIFKSIEKEYNDSKALTEKVHSRPTVLSGILYGDAWFLPGGQNYAATILADAGCEYLWEEDSSHGFLQLSFESVFEKAHNADLWIGVGSYGSLKELGDADHRYRKFNPFVTNNVYTYNLRQGPRGGNEFLELGYLRPDYILKDLIKIAHPEKLPSYELYFHKRLE